MVNDDLIMHPYYSIVFAETVRELMENPPETFGHSGSWDTITFPEDGYEKPPKELFEERFKQNYRNEGFRILREERNKLLNETDWTDQYNIEEWEVYRQILRDIPTNIEDPETPIWPEPPQVKIVQGKNTRTELSDTKADLSETKADLSETKADLQTTLTELAETKTDLEEKTYQIISLEARLAALEQKFISTN
mgnify:CR=1 FL=1